tara:strand:+ start:3596 stop:4012 length:417 start_codon:yes stop_codon:yes gene_type:complete
MILRDIIKKNLLLEKRIGQISAKAEIIIGFDVVKTKHTTDRMKMTSRDVVSNRTYDISNNEMVEFVKIFTKQIAEAIINDEINHNEPFVIKGKSWGLSMSVVPLHIDGTYWKLIITTVFPESEHSSLRVGRGQLVFEK